jgi:CRP-like cAMP-binding protein
MDLARITSIPLFSGLDETAAAKLASVATEVELDAGASLTNEGEFGHALFAVETGTAEVRNDGVLMRSIGPGDVVGEIAVMSSGRRTATVLATSPMTLLAVFKRDVWELEQSAPQVFERLRELRAARLDSA